MTLRGCLFVDLWTMSLACPKFKLLLVFCVSKSKVYDFILLGNMENYEMKIDTKHSPVGHSRG